MSYTVPHTLENTVGLMAKMMIEGIPDIEKIGVSNPAEVFELVKGVPYTADKSAPECANRAECLKRPGYTLVLGGDCDDKVILAGAMLVRMGVPVRIVTTSYRPDGLMQHTYLEMFDGKNWIPFDATYPGPQQIGFEYPYTAKQVWN